MKIFDKIKRVALGGVLLWAMSGCTSGFLEVPPYGNMRPEDYFATDNAAEEMVNAVYSSMLLYNMHSFPWLGVASITSDEAAKGSSPGDNGEDKMRLDEFTFTSDDVSFNNIWEANYIGISRANTALATLPDLEISDEMKSRLMGECYFLRGLFYWNQVRCFGGVPLVTFVPDPTNQADIAIGRRRVTKDEIYDQIVIDLKRAATQLPLKSGYGIKDLGRATRGAAWGLLAKVYMYSQQWPECYEMCDSLINRGGYSLTPDYAIIWREVGQNNEESIFEVQCRGVTPFVSIEGFTEVQAVRNQFGWGFNVPTQLLWDAYPNGATDTRRAATFIVKGQTMWDGTVIITDTPNDYYNQKSYVSETMETYGNNRWMTNKNLRILRYGEILLIAAEAGYNTGKPDSEVQGYVNSIRARAGLTPVTPSGGALLTEILLQRRLEMAFEYDRFFDLIRQGQTYDPTLAIDALSVPNVPNSQFNWEKHQLFPVPQRQIILSDNKLTQNPFY